MSRNRAFRLLKDARARASATSVGGASSRVGGHAAVNATNLTRYVYICVRFFRKRRICFFARTSKNARITGDPEFVGTVLGGKCARKVFARANNGSANDDKSDGGTFERDFRAIFRSRTFSVFFLVGGLPKFFIEEVFFFLSSMPICFYVEMLIFGSKLTFPSLSSLRTVHIRKASVTFPCKSCNSA